MLGRGIAEFKRALHYVKSGKSPGIEEDAMKQLHLLFSTIWKERCVLENWKKSLIVKVPKKGDLTQCDNYRGISLLSVPSKILYRVLIYRAE